MGGPSLTLRAAGTPSLDHTHLRILVAVETFLDLVLIHITESGHLGGHRHVLGAVRAGVRGRQGSSEVGGGQARTHLAPGSFREASVESAALLARVPDSECLPAWQDLLLQKLDAVGPDGGPRGCGWECDLGSPDAC